MPDVICFSNVEFVCPSCRESVDMDKVNNSLSIVSLWFRNIMQKIVWWFHIYTYVMGLPGLKNLEKF